MVKGGEGRNGNESEVEEGLREVEESGNDLNGDEGVGDGKGEGKREMDELRDVNKEEESGIKENIDNGSEVEGIGEIVEEGSELNRGMEELEDGVNDDSNVEN